MSIDIPTYIQGAEVAMTLLDKASKSNLISHFIYKLKNTDFYFKETTREVSLDMNGNGIITHKIDICVVNPVITCEIKRSLNIEDSNIDTKFTSLEEMMKSDIHKAPYNLGFWYTSTENIIQDVEEKYWDPHSPVAVNNPKELQWIFKLNSNKLTPNSVYRILYVISVPGMYPMSNGFIDVSKMPQNIPKSFYTQMKISHLAKKVTYILNLDSGIHIRSAPICEKIINTHNNNVYKSIIRGHIDTNLRQNKYTFVIEKPKLDSIIKVGWELKEN